MKKYLWNNLSFIYEKKVIINKTDICINENDIIALVGDNGSGKTTFLKSLLKNKYNISFTINPDSFYPYLTGYQNLLYFSLINNINKGEIEKVIQKMNLQNVINKKYKHYSMGNRQKLSIARCIMKNADIYLFDEPINGLDISSIKLFKNVIYFLHKNNKAIIISSHILKELDEITNKVYYINNNKISIFNKRTNNNFYIKVDKVLPFLDIYKCSNNLLKIDGNIKDLNNFIRLLILNNINIIEINNKCESIENIIKEENYV